MQRACSPERGMPLHQAYESALAGAEARWDHRFPRGATGDARGHRPTSCLETAVGALQSLAGWGPRRWRVAMRTSRRIIFDAVPSDMLRFGVQQLRREERPKQPADLVVGRAGVEPATNGLRDQLPT